MFIKTFFLSFALLLIASCNSGSKNENFPLLTIYSDFSLDVIGEEFTPVVVLPPKNNILNYSLFKPLKTVSGVQKYSLSMIGKFIIPPTLTPASNKGVNGIITSITISTNDEVVVNISNLNLDAKSIIYIIEKHDWRNFWNELSNQNKMIFIKTYEEFALKLGCSYIDENQMEISNKVQEIKQFITNCIK